MQPGHKNDGPEDAGWVYEHCLGHHEASCKSHDHGAMRYPHLEEISTSHIHAKTMHKFESGKCLQWMLAFVVTVHFEFAFTWCMNQPKFQLGIAVCHVSVGKWTKTSDIVGSFGFRSSLTLTTVNTTECNKCKILSDLVELKAKDLLFLLMDLVDGSWILLYSASLFHTWITDGCCCIGQGVGLEFHSCWSKATFLSLRTLPLEYQNDYGK